MTKGLRPNEQWEIHHKLPLDDSGNNDFGNLVLIRRDNEHYIFNTAQKSITQQMRPGDVKETLWIIPASVIYP